MQLFHNFERSANQHAAAPISAIQYTVEECLQRYAHFNYPINTVTEPLLANGLEGKRMLGEILIHDAIHAPVDDAVENYNTAEQLLNDVAGSSPQAWEDNLTIAKSGLRLASLAVMKSVMPLRVMPPTHVTYEAYRQTLQVAEWLAQLPSDEDGAVKGLMSEAAVLLLCQRYAIRNDIADTWAVTPATSVEDIGTIQWTGDPCKNWDISIWSASQSPAPMLSDKIQVKTNKLPSTRKRYDDDISVVSVNDDLARTAHENSIANRIINNCLREQNGVSEPRGQRMTRILDEHQENLLQIIDPRG